MRILSKISPPTTWPHAKFAVRLDHYFNLNLLASYLTRGKLPDGVRFDMRLGSGPETKPSDQNPGSVAGAMECGTFVGIVKYPEQSWIDYEVESYGRYMVPRISTSEYSPTQQVYGNGNQFMFSYIWGYVDDWNTPQFAGWRISYFLQHGVPLASFAEVWERAKLTLDI